MSKVLKQNKQFLSLLLTTSRDQAAALIDTVTPEQVSAIAEIIHNLLNLPLGKKPKYYINKWEKLFEKIAQKRLSKDAKARLIRKNYKIILPLLWSVKLQLEQLL